MPNIIIGKKITFYSNVSTNHEVTEQSYINTYTRTGLVNFGEMESRILKCKNFEITIQGSII